jgi:adenylate cyclase
MYRSILICCILYFMSFTPILAQTAAALEEQAKRTSDAREKMTLYYKAAEKYLSANPLKASQTAHQAYMIATTDVSDNTMAMKAAYLNGEGFAKQYKYGEAKTRYYRSKENAEKANDTEGTIKAITRMADMAKREGNNSEAEMYANIIKDMKKKTAGSGKNTDGTSRSNREGVAVIDKPAPVAASPATTRPAPSNQAEMNGMRDQFRQQTEQLDRERQQLMSEVNILKKEKEMLNSGMSQLKAKEKELTEQTEDAKQEVEKTSKQLAEVEVQKQNLDKVAARRQKLVEALKNTNKLDSIAYAQERQEQLMQLKDEKNFRNISLLGLGSAILLAFLMFKRFKENQKQKKVLENINKVIEDEKHRSDDLLLNILPPAIAQELKANGKAKAQRYEKASVLFADFKNFTTISESLSPEQLVSELDTHFKAFDFIVAQYKLEKIKTIGDAYMCASGLSDKNTSPSNIVKAALEMQQFLNEMKAEKMAKGEPYFEARIGIHTGPVVAGVVGVKKFAYDIWGDTVNIAARMQEACDPNHINISEATFQEVRYVYQCHFRGHMPAKNKGNIAMYYVEKQLYPY